MRQILIDEFRSRILVNPLSPNLSLYVYKADNGYSVQFNYNIGGEEIEIRTLSDSRGKTKRFKSLDTVYKQIVDKYGCPITVEPSFQLTES